MRHGTNGGWPFGRRRTTEALSRTGLRLSLAALLSFASMVVTGCEIPRDPNDTLEQVRGGTLRVGVVNEPPWTRTEGAEPPEGIEVRLAEDFADELDADVQWIPGAMPHLIESLARYEVDLVIGGFVLKSPGISHAATTNVYLKEPVQLGNEPGAPLPEGLDALDGVRVRVPVGSRAVPTLQSHGAVVQIVEDLSRGEGLVAGPRSLLMEMGLETSPLELAELHRVMLVPPGENGFLVRLEKFLHERRPELEGALEAGTRVRSAP